MSGGVTSAVKVAIEARGIVEQPEAQSSESAEQQAEPDEHEPIRSGEQNAALGICDATPELAGQHSECGLRDAVEEEEAAIALFLCKMFEADEYEALGLDEGELQQTHSNFPVTADNESPDHRDVQTVVCKVQPEPVSLPSVVEIGGSLLHAVLFPGSHTVSGPVRCGLYVAAVVVPIAANALLGVLNESISFGWASAP